MFSCTIWAHVLMLVHLTSSDLAQMVNASVEQGEQGRLFAVVSMGGLQRKVTVEDVLIIEMEFTPTVGDRIRLEKVGWLYLFVFFHCDE